MTMYRFLLFLCSFGLFAFTDQTFAQSLSGQPDVMSVETLLSRLDLQTEGLQNVRRLQKKPKRAAKALLDYFQHRTSVKHPVDRNEKASQRGQAASAKDMEMADNALQHIFIGQPAYPPHFCGEDIDWNSRPVPDNEWVWQLNRMYFWDAMARTYWHSGEEKYAVEWGRQLLDWVQDNPNDEAHHFAWRSIEAGIRGYSWTRLFQYFIDSPSFTPELLVAFLNSCYDHATYLMTRYSSGSNWGLMEAEGMAFIAMTFPEFADAAAWREEAFRRFNREIDQQVYPDGHQRELAMGYHLGCIRWFTRTFELAKLNDLTDAFPKTYLDRVEKMCEVPMKLCLPDGTNVQFGDAWAGTPGQHRDKFADWADLFEREDFRYLATEGQAGQAPDATAYALPESGLYSMRSSWDRDAICLVLKCGPDGGGHCQPDNGTFDVYAGGRNLMPDGGSYIYHGNPEGRAWFRQSKVHQTLTLNGQNTQYAPKQLLWAPDEDLDVLIVENQSYEDLTHRRAVLFVEKRYFIIIDEAFGNGSGDVDIHFQLAPGQMKFNARQLEAASDFPEGWNVQVKALDTEGVSMAEEEGQVSFVYTEKAPRPAFRFRKQKSETTPGVRFITLVAPFEQKMPELQVKLISSSEIPARALQLEITEGQKTSTIGFELE